MKRIYLIDCPGVVPPSASDTPQDILLRGVVRVENVENPEQYIPALLAKTKPQHIERTYALKGYNDHIEFLELLARKGGRLLHGGEPDVDGVAKMVINDFLRGKIPWFTPPPYDESGEHAKGIEGRRGKLGEMGKKRKRDDEETVADTENGDISMADITSNTLDNNDSDEDEFEGFDSDGGVGLSDDGMPDSDSEIEDRAEEDDEEGEEDLDEAGERSAIEDQIRDTLRSNPLTADSVRIPTPIKRRKKT
jgi:nuclear GTP-binding protein